MDGNFIKLVKEYIDIDDNIKLAMKDIKVLKDRKSELSDEIMVKMKELRIDCCNLESGGQIVAKESKSVSAPKLKSIQAAIKETTDMQDEMIEKVMSAIENTRDKKTKETLRRTKGKTKKTDE